ncbi:guanyl-specific ribonuclease Sa [Pseudomonas sp. TE3610]
MAMATGFNFVGDYVKFPNGSIEKIAAHAIMGGLLAEATGSDFKTGAVAAGLNEALINQMAEVAGDNRDLQLMLSQLTGLVAAAAVDGDLNTGAQVAQKATTFNYLYHEEVEQMLAEIDKQPTEEGKRAVRARYAELDVRRNEELSSLCQSSPGECAEISKRLVGDDERLLVLTSQLRANGSVGAAAAVGQIVNSNLEAGQTIASELGSTSAGAIGTLIKLTAQLAISLGTAGKASGESAAPPSRALPFRDPDRLVEVNKTLNRIQAGGPFPYRQDGTVFKNKEGILPSGRYLEYTVDTPGVNYRAARRVITDQGTGKVYYTDDHYKSFIQIDPVKR